MANIMDYLDWRGDVPFSVSPFCEVDSLIFAEFSFVDLNDIVSSRACDEGVPLSLAVARYFALHPDEHEKLGLIVPSQIRPLVYRMAECARYRDVKIRGFVDHIDENIQKQFAAMTFELSEDELYVVFRGTDDTLIGWKENFNMSFLAAVPAQLEAVAYLNDIGANTTHSRIFVGGHSKGGNLAIYAAMRCEETVRERIVRVYNNDGPGYRREVVESDAYRAMKERTVNIIPQTSVVGRLLEHNEQYTVIQSTASGLWQHDGFSWEVKGTSFVPAAALTQESEMIDRSLKKWIAEMSDEQCEQVVDALYRILTATNAKTLTELTKDRNWFWQLIGSSDPQSRKTLVNALSQLTGEAGRLWLESMLPSAMKARKNDDANKQVKSAESAKSKTQQKPAKKGSAHVRSKNKPSANVPKKDVTTRLAELILAEKKKRAAAPASLPRRKMASVPRKRNANKAGSVSNSKK